jgi:hypothetical protein
LKILRIVGHRKEDGNDELHGDAGEDDCENDDGGGANTDNGNGGPNFDTCVNDETVIKYEA